MPAPIARSELPGHRQQIGKSAALSVGHSPALSQRCGRCGSERSAEFGSVNRFRCPHARARGAGRFQRALTPTDLHRPVGRRCGCWPTSTVLFSGICCWQIRRQTLALGIGADADVGFAWSGRRWCRRRSRAASYRVIDNRSENLQHCQWGTLPRSLSAAAAAARKDQRNLAALTASLPSRARTSLWMSASGQFC